MSYRHTFIASTLDHHYGELDKLVVYVCEHSIKGAIGLIVNKPHNKQFHQMLAAQQQLPAINQSIPIYFGGPVEPTGRFVVLHQKSLGRFQETAQMGSDLFLTTSSDILASPALQSADKLDQFRLFFGLIQWRPGELDSQILRDHWMSIKFDSSILFHQALDSERLWERCYENIGLSPYQVHSESYIYQ